VSLQFSKTAEGTENWKIKKTPAMQAGISNQRYSFREVFPFCFILKILWENKRKMETEIQSLPNAA
jgi:hypothetical protein